MFGRQFPFHFDIRSGGTYITGGSFTGTVSAEQLHFYRYRKVLVLQHGSGGLAMNHYAAVLKCPAGATFCLAAHEAVFNGEFIITERRLIKDMPEAVVKRIVGIIAYFH